MRPFWGNVWEYKQVQGIEVYRSFVDFVAHTISSSKRNWFDSPSVPVGVVGETEEGEGKKSGNTEYRKISTLSLLFLLQIRSRFRIWNVTEFNAQADYNEICT